MVSTKMRTMKHPDVTLTNFIKEVCGYDETNDIFELLIDSNYNTIVEIISAADERIEESIYIDDSGNEKPLKSYMKSILKIIRAWNAHLKVKKGMNNVDWTNRSYVN